MNCSTRNPPWAVAGSCWWITRRIKSFVSPLRDGSTLTHPTTNAGLSRPQALFLEPLVEVGDIFAVAVEQQRRLALAGADELLGGLAPARMRDLRIDVGPEPVFGG